MAKAKKHGGARAGAGRKSGPKIRAPLYNEIIKAEEKIQEMNAGDGKTPIDVMLIAMNDEFAKQMDLDVKDRKWREAVAIAAAVAPYVHPRLAAVAVEADVKVTTAQDILQDLDGQTRGLPGPPASSQTTH